jgi:hypothetical protein
VDERFLLFAPGRFVSEFDFADAVDDRVPKFAEHDQGFSADHVFIQHFPHDRQFH